MNFIASKGPKVYFLRTRENIETWLYLFSYATQADISLPEAEDGKNNGIGILLKYCIGPCRPERVELDS